jgi:ADP-ribose pyrophosphatase YjhB (NUDIX family)
VVAQAVIRRGDAVLVQEGFDPAVEGCAFHRLPGGGVEFGELGACAIERELHEEFGLHVQAGAQLTVIENHFLWDGRAGHEIVLVHEATLLEHRRYRQHTFDGTDDHGQPLRCVWRSLDGTAEQVPLVPLEVDGLLAATRAA